MHTPQHRTIAFIFLCWGFAAQANIPDKIYHYGSYEVLAKNIQANTVPKADWDQYIMGEKSRYGLKKYRRGLYGTSHPAYASHFADIAVGNGKQPWLMEVAITEDCRNETPFNVSEFFSDARVIQFLSSGASTHFRSADEFRDRCFLYSSELEMHVPLFETVTNQNTAGECEQFLDEALDALGARVMVDGEWEESWYLRDRGCIESIRGTPEDVLEMMEIPGFWSKNTPNGFKRPGASPMSAASFVPLLAGVLAMEHSASEPALRRVSSAVTHSDLENPVRWKKLKPRWVSEIGNALFRNREECTRLNRKAEFQSRVSSQLSELNRLTGQAYESKAEELALQTRCD